VISRVLVDTGPLVALFSARDQFHPACVEQLKDIALPMLTCWPVLVEAAYLLRSHPIAQRDLFRGCGNGLLKVLEIKASEVPDLVDLLERYEDLEPQIADIALVHLANREKLGHIFTFDRRDFLVYRGTGGQAFELLPEMSQ
jgi:uncharacterized protein